MKKSMSIIIMVLGFALIAFAFAYPSVSYTVVEPYQEGYIVKEPVGGGYTTPPAGDYIANKTGQEINYVVLKAYANTGWAFAHWNLWVNGISTSFQEQDQAEILIVPHGPILPEYQAVFYSTGPQPTGGGQLTPPPTEPPPIVPSSNDFMKGILFASGGSMAVFGFINWKKREKA